MSVWELVGFVKRSKQRQRILRDLDAPKTPTELYEKTSLARSHISRTLREFSERGLVECLTPSQRSGRLYRITRKGKSVLDRLAAQ